MGRLKLSTIIARRGWTKALHRIASSPNEARSWDHDGELPIHRACRHQNVPVNVIKALIDAYPQSVEKQTKMTGLIPLQFAVCCVSSTINGVVRLLLLHYTVGATVRDACGETSLISHLYYSSQPSLEVVQMLVEAHPDAVRTSDKYKWYPLHFAARRGDLEIPQYLIELYPEALLAKTEFDMTPQDVADEFCKCQLRDRLREEKEKRFGSNQSTSTEETGQSNALRWIRGEVDKSIKGEVFEDDLVGTFPVKTHEEEDTRVESNKSTSTLSTEDTGQTDRNNDVVNDSILHKRSDDTSINIVLNDDGSPGTLPVKTLTFEPPSDGNEDIHTVTPCADVNGKLASIRSKCQLHERLCEEEENRTGSNKSTSTPLTVETGKIDHNNNVVDYSSWHRGKDNTSTEIVVSDDNFSGSFSVKKDQLELSSGGNNESHTVTPYPIDNANITGICNDNVVAKGSTDLDIRHCLSLRRNTFMHCFREKLEKVEAFWDVQPLSAQNAMRRITTLERKVFNEVKKGGLKDRLSALVYVDGTDNGTWEEWISGIEMFLLKKQHQGTIIERVEVLEKIVEGEVKIGNLHNRLVTLNNVN